MRGEGIGVAAVFGKVGVVFVLAGVLVGSCGLVFIALANSLALVE